MRVKHYLLLFVSGIYFAISGACGGDSVGSIPSEDIPDSPPPLTDPENAEAISFGLVSYMDYDSYSYMVWKDGAANFDSTGCSISKGSTAQEDIKCVVDVNELDLFFHGIELEAVVPTGTCDYVVVDAPWYYKYETGVGPANIAIEVDTDADGNVQDGRCGVDGDPPLSGNCAPGVYPEINQGISAQEREFACRYDHRGEGGPNCCTGSYVLTVTTQDIATPGQPVQDISPTPIPWGGPDSECFGGGAFLGGFTIDEDGNAIGKITYTREDGFADRLTISGGVDRGAADNLDLANWHVNVEECDGVNTTSCDDRHHHRNNSGSIESYDPIVIDPLEDRITASGGPGGDSLTKANDSWTLSCMDDNREVIHRIRVYIREYDHRADFDAFVANPVNGTQGADKSGVESATPGVNDCPGFTGFDCNDYDDIDNFTPDATPATQGPTGYDTCTACFPNN